MVGQQHKYEISRRWLLGVGMKHIRERTQRHYLLHLLLVGAR
jgi:hypothetical protein